MYSLILEVEEIEQFKLTTINGTVYTADFVVVECRCSLIILSS